MRNFRRGWSWMLLVLLVAPVMMGTTYRWVDAGGQVHFTDTPPPAGTTYEIVAAPPAPPAPVAPTAAPGPVQSVPAAAAEPWPQTVPDARRESRDDARCVDALYQIEVLAGDWKVYKAGPGDERTYLDDRDRPAEIARLTGERDVNCSDDPAVLAAQERRARDLFQAMSPDCREAREKLGNLQRPSAKSAPSDIEKQQGWIAANCPDVSRAGLWLADWRYVRQKPLR